MRPFTRVGVHPVEPRPDVLCHRCYAIEHISPSFVKDVKVNSPEVIKRYETLSLMDKARILPLCV